jgi:hypothetical protein
METIGTTIFQGINSGHVTEFLNWVRSYFGSSSKKLADRTGHSHEDIIGNEMTFDVLRTMFLGDIRSSQKVIVVVKKL